MTLEEFQEFAQKKIQEGLETERRVLLEQNRRLDSKRRFGLKPNFIKEEDGHWIVVKDNEIVERCDTKAEAWQALNSY